MSGHKADPNGSHVDQGRNKMANKQETLTVSDRLALANKLESKLSAKNESAEAIQKTQHQLCEHLTDVLINDPALAMRKDCSARLWRGCFYSNIVRLRGAVSKTKRRNKGNGEVTVVEERLFSFLKEAINLYVFLIDNYDQKLTSTESGVGVVPNLYRLLIYQGDLHRYKNDFNKSESFYLKASRLAPGRGNPYNQLAVVSQQSQGQPGYLHPKTCVALYWYVRSLLATYEPFETSRPNMTRLFESNSLWLDKNVLPSPPKSSGKTKKMSEVQQRNHKNSLCRHFLSEFVHLHGMLFSSKATPKVEEIVNQASSVTGQFRKLTAEHAVGEALIFKMMAITVYSYTLPLKRHIALACVLEFCAALANVVTSYLGDADGQTKSLSKLRTSSNKGVEMTPIKMLPPLIMLCEWVASLDELSPVNMNSDSSSFMEQANVTFWEAICVVATHLRVLQENLRNDHAQKFNGTFREHDTMKGFSPFTSFVMHEPHSSYFSGDHDENYRGFLSPSDAADSLRRSAANSSSNASIEAETYARLGKFFGFVDKFVVTDENDIKHDQVFISYDKTTMQYIPYDKDAESTHTDIEQEVFNNIFNEYDAPENSKMMDKHAEEADVLEDSSPKDDEDNEDDVIVYSGTMERKDVDMDDKTEESRDNKLNEKVTGLVAPGVEIAPGLHLQSGVLSPMKIYPETTTDKAADQAKPFTDSELNIHLVLKAGSCENDDVVKHKVITKLDGKLQGTGGTHTATAPQALPVGRVIHPPPGFGNITRGAKESNTLPSTTTKPPASSFVGFTSAISSAQSAPGTFPLISGNPHVGLEVERTARPLSNSIGSVGMNRYDSSLRKSPAPPPGFSRPLFQMENRHAGSIFFDSLNNASSAFCVSDDLKKKDDFNGTDGYMPKTSNPFAVSSMPRSHQCVGGLDLPGFSTNGHGFLGISPFLSSADPDPKATSGKQPSPQFIPSQETWNPFV